MFRAQLLAILRRVGLRLIRLYAIRRNVHADKSVHIGIGTVIEATHRLDIGAGTYIGKNCTIVANGSIGKGVLIANTVGLVGALDHDFRSVGVPVRSAPWIGDADYPYDAQKDRIDIEDDVWIGYGAIILSTVRVGRGAIVAAGSVVRKDVEPYSIVAGVPARVVGERFDHHVRQHHEVGLVQFWAKRGVKHLNGMH